jgi:hypothetical protein
VAALATAATAAGLDAVIQSMIVAEIQASAIIDASGPAASVNGTSLSDALLIGEGGHTVSTAATPMSIAPSR